MSVDLPRVIEMEAYHRNALEPDQSLERKDDTQLLPDP